MAHQSRLAAFYLNTSYLGLFNQGLTILIGGTDRTANVSKGTIRISKRRGRRTRCSFATRESFRPTAGQEVVFRNGGSGTGLLSGQVVFRGRIVRVEQISRKQTGAVWHRVDATDEWFLNRFDVVTKLYTGSQGVNAVVNDILTTYTDGGYAVGNVDDALGSIRASFSYTKVATALRRLAKATGAFLVIHPRNLHVSMLTGVSDGHAITLADGGTDYWGFRYTADLSQVRTRVVVQGRSSRLSAAASVGDTSLFLDDVDDFASAGGYGRLRGRQFQYTGLDMAARSLTGVTGLTTDGADGDEVHLVVIKNDTAAQTALATLLGGGASGIVTHYINNGDLTADEADAVADEDLALFSTTLPAVEYRTTNRFNAIPGKTVTVSLTAPETISTSAIIESVEIAARGETPTDRLPFEYRVRAAPNEDRLTDLLTPEVT